MNNYFYHSIRFVRGRRIATACCLALALLTGWSNVHGGELDQTGTQWAPVIEWSLENTSWSGNPFDLEAHATFVHAESGETRTTPFFYDGGDTWKFRFTATRVGTWTVQTASGDSDLDGKQGTVEIQPNPDPEAKGFIVAHGSKFAKQVGEDGHLEAFVPNIYMNLREFGNPEKCGWTDMSPTYSDPDVFSAYLDEVEEHGSNTAFALVANQWFKSGAVSSGDHDSVNPDPETFRALEQAIQMAQERGMHLHIWAWGDESRDWTPSKVGGVNGTEDRRVQRYIAARLGPLPAWTMGYGFDLSEWANEEDVASWEAYINEHSGWEHLLSAREDGKFPDVKSLPVGGYDDQPENNFYDAAIDLLNHTPGRPARFERRFSYRRDGVWDMETTRRAFWQFTLAGGAASIWGLYPPDCSAYVDDTYSKPHQMRTHREFWKKRFLLDMERANGLSDDGDTLVLADGDHAVFYRENTDSIHLDLSDMSGPQPVIAVDTLNDYEEIDLGMFDPNSQTWDAPYSSDWALAVGTFTSTVVDPTAPAAPAELGANGVSTERIDLTWQAPYNGGAQLTGYRIQRKIAGETSFSDLVANTGNTNTSYSDLSVTAETTYVYRVTAINSIGESEYSNEATATATEPVEPVLDLKAFGAVGDGTTDDTQALRDAIDHFGNEGLALGIPAGRYLITEDISIGKAVQFVGSGNGEAVITSNGGNARLYVRESGTSFTDIGFEDMVAPIVLESRSGYVLENVTFDRCRFENLEVHDKNQGVIGLPTGSSSERPYPIRNLVVKDSIFQGIDANAINIRANISDAQVINNQFLDIDNLPDGASPADTFVVRLGDPEATHAASQGNHLIEGNVIRNISKSTVDGNLIGILLYGDYSVIRDNLIEGVDGTATGLSTNAIFVRGSHNQIVANTIRDVRGAADYGAIHIQGEMALGNTGNVVSQNVLENIEGMFAVQAYTSDLDFSGNAITAAAAGGFVHRSGSNVTISENTFSDADVLLQTTTGDAAVSGNDFLESRITLSQNATAPATRTSVSIVGNLFRRTLVDSPIPLIQLADGVAEEFVSIRNNRFENMVESTDGESAVNLVANGTLQQVEIIDNDVFQAGAEGTWVFVIDSPEETVSGNEITYGDDPGSTPPVDESLPVELTMGKDGTGPTMTWGSESGYIYQVQVSSDLETWTNHGDPIPGTGSEVQATDLPGADQSAMFYRLLIEESAG